MNRQSYSSLVGYKVAAFILNCTAAITAIPICVIAVTQNFTEVKERMGKVIVQDYTYKKPITMIGVEAGICWGANTSNDEKNYLRGIDCLESGHGRTFEFPDVYLHGSSVSGTPISAVCPHAFRRVRDISTMNMVLDMLRRQASKVIQKRKKSMKI